MKIVTRAQINGSPHNAVNLGTEKETVAAMSVVAYRRGELKEVVTARWYMGRSGSALTVYCSLWVHGAGDPSGHGKAGGGGYDKDSASLQGAIDSAGVQLFNGRKRAHIDGRGESATREALLAIASAAGYPGNKLIVSHR